MTREQRLLEALQFYTRSGQVREVRGRIIEIDPDAGPLYEKYEVPYTDDGTVARQAIAEYHAASAEGPGDRELRDKLIGRILEGVIDDCLRALLRAELEELWAAARAHTPKGQDDTAEENGERAEFWKKKYFELKGQGAEFPMDSFTSWLGGQTFDDQMEAEIAIAQWAWRKALASRPKAEGRELTIKVRKAPEGGFAFLYEAVELNQFVNDGKIVEQDVRFREVLERGE